MSNCKTCIPTPLKQPENIPKLKLIVQELINGYQQNEITDLDQFTRSMVKKYKISFARRDLIYTYNLMKNNSEIELSNEFEQNVRSFKVRENSGVMVFTVVMSPNPETGEFLPDFKKGEKVDETKINPDTGELRQNFTCKWDCYYCPNWENPLIARSYIPDEPAVKRGLENGWDIVKQIQNRKLQYEVNGLSIDKAEVIVEGGTYNSYPPYYLEKMHRDIFYAFNTLFSDTRVPLSLQEEIKLNETAKVRVAGLSIETRPDCVTRQLIRDLRRRGVTRIQLGVQHTNDEILKKVNRQCTTKKVKKAIKMLKDTGFKIAIHLMPDLPGSDPYKDLEMFNDILYDEDLQIDYLKIYPTAVTPYTKIKEWYDKGEYEPYAMKSMDFTINGKTTYCNPLIELIIDFNRRVHPWIRNERIQRDIPVHNILAGSNKTNLGQIVSDEMKKRGLKCECIRCREVKDRKTDLSLVEMVRRDYRASDGKEIFLSYENKDRSIIYGFLRLRLTSTPGGKAIKELENCALIRELHVYGKMNPVGTKNGSAQHYGFGKKLLQEAEDIARENGFKKIAVIAGVGVRDYYRKKGYKDGEYYLIKDIRQNSIELLIMFIILMILFYLWQ